MNHPENPPSDALPGGGQPQSDSTESPLLAGDTPTPNENAAPDLAVPLKPSWLHPTSLIFDLISHSRELIVPAAIAIFGAASGNLTGLYFGMAIFIPAFILSAFRYFTLRYKIDNGELVVKKGLLFRRIRTVPISRIQNIDLLQNPLHRLFRVAEVKIETASGTEPEAVLRVLSLKKFGELREQIFLRDPITNPQITSPTSAPEPDAQIPMPETRASQLLVSIPTSWLIKAGIASNRGLVFLGIAMGAWYQFKLWQYVNLDDLKQMLPSLDGTLRNTLLIAALALAILIVLRVASVAWFISRFHGYQLQLCGEDLRISCGLFTKITATVPRNRIQLISIHRPLFLRWMGLASIRIETAGGGGMSGQDKSNSRRWFVPVLPEQGIATLIQQLRTGIEWQEKSLDWKPLSQNTGRRLRRRAIVRATVLAVIGVLISQPWGWLAGVVALPFLVLWEAKKSSALRYVRTEQYVVYRSGLLTPKTSITFWDKVQTVSISQTPFDKRWKMGTLRIDTAAAGPAEHYIRVHYLDAAFAYHEFKAISCESSKFEPDFG